MNNSLLVLNRISCRDLGIMTTNAISSGRADGERLDYSQRKMPTVEIVLETWCHPSHTGFHRHFC